MISAVIFLAARRGCRGSGLYCGGQALTANYRFRGEISVRNKIVGRPLRTRFDKMPNIPSGSSAELNYAKDKGVIGFTVSIRSMPQRTFKNAQPDQLGIRLFCLFETAFHAVTNKGSKLRGQAHVLLKAYKTGRFKGGLPKKSKLLGLV